MLHPENAPFRKKRRSSTDVQDDKHRQQTGPGIYKAQKKADEAHVRETNLALDAAHTKAEEAHVRATNTGLDAAHTAAEAAQGTADFVKAGHVDDGSLVGDKQAFHTLPNTAYGTDSVDGRVLGAQSVDGSIISDTLNNPSQGTYGLRTIGGAGGSNSAAASNHNHSIGFKSNLTQDERKELLDLVHQLEEKQRKTVADKLQIKTTRMMIDEPDYSAEELVDFIDNGDAWEVHNWRVEHEQEYYAREMLLYDPTYRVNALRNKQVKRIAEELGVDYTKPVTEADYRQRRIKMFSRRMELQNNPEILREGRQHHFRDPVRDPGG